MTPHQFKILDQRDRTVKLLDLTLHPSITYWALTNQSYVLNELVDGSFSHPPEKSVYLGLPTFIPVK
jgi:hypothetical protein